MCDVMLDFLVRSMSFFVGIFQTTTSWQQLPTQIIFSSNGHEHTKKGFWWVDIISKKIILKLLKCYWIEISDLIFLSSNKYLVFQKNFGTYFTIIWRLGVIEFCPKSLGLGANYFGGHVDVAWCKRWTEVITQRRICCERYTAHKEITVWFWDGLAYFVPKSKRFFMY